MSHNLRVVSSLTKALSPRMGSRSPINTVLTYMSSGPSPPSSGANKSEKKISSKEKEQTSDKGDTYKAGESYYSFNPYSFYDMENDMKKYRSSQPSSQPKEKVYCKEVEEVEVKIEMEDKDSQLAEELVEPPRRLLPYPWGHLVEWPDHSKKAKNVKIQETSLKEEKEVKKDPNAYYPMVEGTYDVKKDKNDCFFKARIPL